MEIKTIQIEKLKPAVYNPRIDLQPGDPNYERLKKSIAEFNVVDPIIVNRINGEYRVVGGHQRLKILKERGDREVQVSVVEFSERKEKALNLALNKISGDWDLPKLKDILEELDTGDMDIEITGFDEAEIEDLMTQFHPDEAEEDDFDVEANIPEESRTNRGDIWILGKHRVMCGDSTKRDDIERLMIGKKANVVLADPPYGLEVAGVHNDEGPKIYDFTDKWLNFVLPNLKKNALFVSFFSTRTFPILLDLARQKGLDFLRCLTLYKRNDRSYPWRGWLLKSEAILLFSQGKPNWPLVESGHYSHDTYLDERQGRVPPGLDLDIESQNFPIKPIKVVGDLIKKTVRHKSVVCDPFLGSGTTLIAAEQLGRICFGMEIEPRYVDVVVERYKKFKGLPDNWWPECQED